MKEFWGKYKSIIIVAIIVVLVLAVLGIKIIVDERTKPQEAVNFEPDPQLQTFDLKMYYFSADNCPTCTAMNESFYTVMDEFSSEMNFELVDVVKKPNFATKYQVNYTPTFIIVNGEGNVVKRKTGEMSLDELREFIRSARQTTSESTNE